MQIRVDYFRFPVQPLAPSLNNEKANSEEAQVNTNRNTQPSLPKDRNHETLAFRNKVFCCVKISLSVLKNKRLLYYSLSNTPYGVI